MATQNEDEATLKAIKAQAVKVEAEMKTLLAARDALVAEKAALVFSNQTLAKTIADKNARIAELEAQVANPPVPPPTQPNGDSTAGVSAEVAGLKAQVQALDDLNADTVVNPPPVEPPPTTPPSDVYLRPLLPTPAGNARKEYSAGFGDWNPASGDFSSTQANVILEPDDATKVGVARVTVLDMSNSVPTLAPTKPWNAGFFPDDDAKHWIEYGGVTLEQIGQPLAIARGYGGWSNAAFIVTSKGYVGTAGTSTGTSPWQGLLLPPNKKPTGIAVTGRSEFCGVTVIDTDTGKGELAMIVNWGGGDLERESLGNPFPHDWPTSHPGLAGPGIVTGMKCIGYIDLGLAAPSGISIITNKTSDRVNNKTDGNAGLLQEYDLNLQADRDSFFLGNTNPSGAGNNANYIASWGTAVVISKTENKAVYVDLTPLFAGYKAQYLTTQANYDATKPKNPGNAWWDKYGKGDADWPATFTARPDLKPVVKATVNVTAPTAVLLSFKGENELVVASQDGTLNFFKGGKPGTTSAVSANGSVKVNPDITCLAYDKFPSQYGIRNGTGFLALSRSAKAIHRIDSWGSAAKETLVMRDPRWLDPIHCEMSDTHGIDTPLLTTCDHDGKKITNHRFGDLTLTNWGGTVFPVEGGAAFECTGILDLPGKPLAVCGTNVN